MASSGLPIAYWVARVGLPERRSRAPGSILLKMVNPLVPSCCSTIWTACSQDALGVINARAIFSQSALRPSCASSASITCSYNRSDATTMCSMVICVVCLMALSFLSRLPKSCWQTDQRSLDSSAMFKSLLVAPSRRNLEHALSGKPGDVPAQRSVVVTSGAAPPAGWREDQQRNAEGDQHWSQVAQCVWPLARDLAPALLLRGRTASSTGEQTHTQPAVSPEAARRISCEKRWAQLRTP